MKPKKFTLHLAPVNRGAFSNLPARPVELEADRIRADCADAFPCLYHGHNGNASLYVVGNEFGPMGAVWCRHDGDAINALVDADLAGGILVDDETLAGMTDEERDELHPAGNAGELCDLTNAWIQRVDLDGPRDWLLIACIAEAVGANHSTLADL